MNVIKPMGRFSKVNDKMVTRALTAVGHSLALADGEFVPQIVMLRLVSCAKDVLSANLRHAWSIETPEDLGQWPGVDISQIPCSDERVPFSDQVLELCGVRDAVTVDSNFIWTVQTTSRVADILTYQVMACYDNLYPATLFKDAKKYITDLVHASIFTCLAIWAKLLTVSAEDFNSALDSALDDMLASGKQCGFVV